jgi:anion-transporting  ArsA/GET3 family ATPase
VITDAPPLGQLFSYLRAPATVAGLVPTGVVQNQAIQMRATLADPTISGLVLVTLPEELPVIETAEALEQLAEEPVIDLAAVVANRVLDPLEIDPDELAAVSAGPHRSAAALHRTLAADQHEWLRILPETHRLPFRFGLETPGEVAAKLAEEWELA